MRRRSWVAIVAAQLVFAARGLAQFGMAPGAAQAGPAASGTLPIRDIIPPVDVLPYPAWMLWSAGAAAAVVIAGIAYLAWRLGRRRPAPAPPTPREVALRALEQARPAAEERAPYDFSIHVSDILRRYVTAQYGLHATEQTSPEFLAAASQSPHFTAGDKRLLAEFLEKCDVIKFARAQAGVEDSRALLEQAFEFVRGRKEEVAGG